jgi:hypothetical protein
VEPVEEKKREALGAVKRAKERVAKKGKEDVAAVPIVRACI